MSKSVQEMALDACDDAFKDSIRAATNALATSLNQAGGDEQKKREAVERYSAGLKAQEAAHAAAQAAVKKAFPNT